jgi:hypothetical protein
LAEISKPVITWPGDSTPTRNSTLRKGRPYAGWCDLDLIIDFGCAPPHETHPFIPCWKSKKDSEAEFRTLVKAMHCIYS